MTSAERFLADLIDGHARVLASLIMMLGAALVESVAGWVLFAVGVLVGVQGLLILRRAS